MSNERGPLASAMNTILDERNVDTIAALRALTSGSRRGVVTVLGYTTTGDGGGGTFRWDAASTADDDAGITIKPTGLSGAGRWVRLYTGRDIHSRWYGAKHDGTTDDYAAHAACVAAIVAMGGGTFTPDSGVSCISANLTIPGLVSIEGFGGAMYAGTRVSVFKCTASGAGITFTGTGGSAAQFAVDGNSVANACITYSGVVGAKTFIGVSAFAAALDNWVISSVQNCTFIKCEANEAGRDNLVIDLGAGGLLFSQCEFNAAARHNLYTLQSGASPVGVYATPNHIQFSHCIFERPAGDYPGIKITSGPMSFYKCVVQGAKASPTVPLIDITAAALQVFNDCPISMATAYTAAFKVGSAAGLRIDGGAVVGTTYAIDIVSGGYVYMITPPVLAGVTMLTVGSSDAAMSAPIRTSLISTRTAANLPMVSGLVTGDAGQRVRIFADGSYGIGDGTNFTFATGFHRDASGNLAIDAPAGYGLTATKATFTTDTATVRVQPIAIQYNLTGGSVAFACTSGVHQANLTGNVTGWSISGSPITGQEIEIQWVQGAGGGFTLAGNAAAIKLAGGSVTLSAAQFKTDTIRFRWNGSFWVELSRSLNA